MRVVAALAVVLVTLVFTGLSSLVAGAATSYGGASAAAWPADWNSYTYATGQIIADVNGDQNPDSLDLASGSCVGVGCTGPEPSVLYASDGTTAFFRIRMSENIYDATKGGLVGGTFLVQIYSVATSAVAAVVGIDGKSSSADYVYVADAPGGVINKVYEWPFNTASSQVSTGMRVVSAPDASGNYFLDFQVPVSFITAISGGAVTPSTPIKLYYGSSAAANLATINKDFMTGDVNTIDWDDLSDVSLNPASIDLTSSAVSATGPNPPQEAVTSTYTVTLTATNPGGGPLTGTVVNVPAAPAGVTYSSASTATGSITGSPLVWNIGTLLPGQTATATFTASLLPAIGTGGSTLTLVNIQSASGTDAPFAAVRNDTAPALTVGPVVPVVYYAVDFNSHGGTAVGSQSLVAGSLVTQPAPPTLTHYSFNGWFTAASGGSLWSFGSGTVTGAMTLHAQWSPINWTASFNSGGGTAVSSQSIFDGDSVTEPADPTRSGYEFDGWYTSALGTTLWDFPGTSVTSDVTLYAQWTPIWTVSYDSQGGGGVGSEAVPDGQSATDPGDPGRTHYTFQGWFTAPSGGSLWDFSSPITQATTLYAQWAPILWTVSFDGNGGSATADQIVLDGDQATVPSNPSFSGYLFQGWFTAPSGGSPWNSGDAVTADRTLYAQWSLIAPDTNVVSFDSHGGSAEPDQSVTDGDPVVEPTDPTRPGYQFDGWFTLASGGVLWDFTTTITDGLTLHAQWTAIEWTVDFDSQGGSSEPDQTVLDSFKVTEPTDPTRAHYVFDGWFTEASGGVLWEFDVDGVYADTTLFAHWTPINWTVSFATDGGSAVGDQTVLDGDPASEPGVPTRAGFVFDGWFDAPVGGNAWDWAAGITEDTTIYAHWTEVYTVTYDSHGGSAVASQDVNDGDTATEPTPPTRAGFVFLGWDDDIDGGSPWSFSTPIVGDTTLHAQWAPIWTVTFASNGGSAVGDEEVTDGDTADEPTDPTRIGYLFGGWFLLDDTAWDFGDPITEDTDLYAHWSPVQWLVQFDTQGGGIFGSQLVGTGALANFPGFPNKPGQIFQGWFTAPSGGVPFEFTLEAIGSDITLYAHWQAVAAAPEQQALADTGTHAVEWAGWALVLIVAGLGALVFARREASRQQLRSGR